LTDLGLIESYDSCSGGSFGKLSTPRRLPFGLTHPHALVVDFAHEFAIAEHADDLAPILASAVRPIRRGDLLQGFDSLGKRFQCQIIY
jgi:hypothetical protein